MDIEQLYRLFFHDVYYYLLYLCKDKPLAEALTSDVFFKVMRQNKPIHQEESSKSYLLTTARHTYIDHLKKQNYDWQPLDDTEEIGTNLTAEDYLVTQENMDSISSAIAKLDEPQCTIVTLRLLEEWSFEAIGALYNKSQNWACVTFHRARKKLQKSLEDNDDH